MRRWTPFAPQLERVLARRQASGAALAQIENLHLEGAMSLRGIEALTGLRKLSLRAPVDLRHLHGLTGLEQLHIDARGWHRPRVELEVLAALVNLRELSLYWLRADSLPTLADLPLSRLELRFCELRRQSLRLPATLVELDLDDSPGLSLTGTCPRLRHVDLWATRMQPMAWLAKHEELDELWLCGCAEQTLTPLLALARPPRWIFLDPVSDAELAAQKPVFAALETRGAHICMGSPHECGVWLPSCKQLSPLEHEPQYLSPGWPRERPTND